MCREQFDIMTFKRKSLESLDAGTCRVTKNLTDTVQKSLFQWFKTCTEMKTETLDHNVHKKAQSIDVWATFNNEMDSIYLFFFMIFTM